MIEIIDKQTRIFQMKEATKLFDDVTRTCTDSVKLAEAKVMFNRIINNNNKSYGLDFQTDLSLFDIMFLIKARHELEIEREKERRENCECCH